MEVEEDQISTQWPHCTSCLIPERFVSELEGKGKKLMECAKCKTVGRKVKYCNRDCQTNDWKWGNPPHKVICGRNFRVQSASSANITGTVSEAPPDPDPGYIRSEALQYQISLQESRLFKVPYFLMEPYPKPNIGIRMDSLTRTLMFQIYKKNAMKNGDPRSVAIMYLFLKNGAIQSGFSPARVILQLSEEYRVDTNTLTSLITEEERKDQGWSSPPVVVGDGA